MAGTIQFSQVYGGNSNVSKQVLPNPPEADINTESSPLVVDKKPALIWAGLVGLLVGARILYEMAE